MHFFDRQCRYIALRDSFKRKIALKKQTLINRKGDIDDSRSICDDIEEELELNSEHFLFSMWGMNRFFVEKGVKTFALLPLLKEFVPSAFLHIDTEVL